MRLYWVAQMFYSRLPVPQHMTSHEPTLLNEATRYFPLVGAVVALLSTMAGVVLYLLSGHADVAALFALLASVWITGAFHEDGLADVCDGFGGGWQAQQILDIMKDSRLGTYGAVGLWGALSLRWLMWGHLLKQGVWFFVAGVLAASVLSRWAAVCTIKEGLYARSDATSKLRPVAKGLSRQSFYVACAIAFVVAVLAVGYVALLAIALLYLVQKRMYHYFKAKIGGYTGDCLGAIQQVGECVALLCFLLYLHITTVI
ncbi:adenosylcobinamide-GDP ribazoletransferase [Thermonema lapsum]|uniref:Adenosylcobinamide-GDP ribazoletransferase n=1 Tax=Thermonema lapsum TaxID=28195 RepID=A0A846MT83_9BACT|nr:adenosylcobinamide-GDP ribazoletransferase [Thermonema lapsum]NIK74783.1 adenosylcobinamide-GDP ribazoletransferase [Thermonema lapsum]